jgi:hypothetical protein
MGILEDIADVFSDPLRAVGEFFLGDLFEQGFQTAADVMSPIAEAFRDSIEYIASSADERVLFKFRRGNLNDYEIIGLKDGSIIFNGSRQDGTPLQDGDVLVDVFDTTIKPDAAQIRLENTTGNPIVYSGVSVRGKIVLSLAGKNGYESETLQDLESQYTNGVNSLVIENKMIIDQDQIKDLLDYYWKQNGVGEPKKHFYSIGMVGRRFDLTPGKIYTIVIGEAGDPEYINVDARLESLKIQGGTNNGATVAIFRETTRNWTRTLTPSVRNISDGNPGRLSRGGATRVVGSSTFIGDADYLCDGTNDEIEIQAAIDELAGIGGGTVLLTNGTFSNEDVIYIYGNVIVAGEGKGTIFNGNNIVYLGNKSSEKDNAEISNILFIYDNTDYVIYGFTTPNSDGKEKDTIANNIYIEDSTISDIAVYQVEKVDKIAGKNIEFTNVSKGSFIEECFNVSNIDIRGVTSVADFVVVNRGSQTTKGVYAENIDCGNQFQAVNGVRGVNPNLIQGVISDVTVIDVAAVGIFGIFNAVQVTNCVIQDVTLDGAGGTAILASGVSNCEINNIQTNSNASDLRAYSGFWIVNSKAIDINCSGTADGVGFDACFSIQQNSSTGNDINYRGSYASNNINVSFLAADTPNGGFNS